MGNRIHAYGRALLTLTVFMIALALPGAAQAASTGSDLIGTSSPVTCEENPTCILSQGDVGGDPLNNVVREDGTITNFTFRHVTGDVAFVVIRSNGGGSFSVVGATDYLTGSGDDEEESYTLRNGIAVREGDFIGLALDTGASVGARAAAGEPTDLIEFTDEQSPEVTANDQAAELFLNATYEPADAGPGPDPDQGSDDGALITPTPDPLAALKAGQKPKVRILGKSIKASKKYSVKVTVKNPNGYRVKGKLTLKAKRLKLGSKAFSIAADSTKTVTIKLARKARSRLARRRKMKASASASFKGPIGKAGSVTKTLTVKAPPKPKRKVRRPSPGGGGGGGGLFRPPICVPHIEYDADGWAHAIPC